MAERPNILWFCTDQQRFDTIAALGNPCIRTPNLDAFCESGTAFTRAFSQSPVCTPSRASFLTGRYPRCCRGRQNGQAEFHADEVLVTRLLADAGYDGGLAGKLHLSACQGISEKEHRPRDGYRNFWWSHHPNPDWPDSDYALWLAEQGLEWRELYRVPPESRHAYPGVPAHCHQTAWCVEKTIEHIDQSRGPWFMSVNPFDPHHPFDPAPEYLALYDADDVPAPAWREGEWEAKSPYQAADHAGAYGGRGISPTRLTERQQREIVAAYYAMVSHLDAEFGRLMNHLADTGRLDDTIVIYMSDHGEMLGDHGILLKGPHFYECAVRVPLILSWPGRWRAGRRCDALVELLDLAPTLLEAAGLPACERMQGRPLTGLLTGATDRHRDDVYCEYHNAMGSDRNFGGGPPYASMVRTARHKCVVYHGIDAGELYDLETDPGEFENLWHAPAHRELRESMVKRCFDRAVFTLDPWPPRIAGF